MLRIKRKGFTLVEIIVTVGLLAVLAVIIILNVNNNLKYQEDKEYAEFINKIKSAANVYIAASPEVEKYVKMEKYYIITIDNLNDAGLISTSTLIDPESKKVLKDLEEDNPKRYIKVYDDEEFNDDKSNATLIEYPVNNINEFQVYIKYVMNGFGSACNTQRVGILKDTTLCNPTDENADFTSWYLDENLTKPVTYNDGKYYKTNKNVTLYAKWKKNKGPKIEYLNLTSTNNDEIFKLNTINIELKITDVYNSNIKFCLQTSSDVKSCTWKDYDNLYKEGNVKLNIENYSGSKITYYVFAKNDVAEEDSTKMASLNKEYRVYTACSYKVENSLSACINSCSAACVKDGSTPTCTKNQYFNDKYIEGKSCGSEKISATCNEDKNCCDNDSIVEKKTTKPTTCDATRKQTITTKYVSTYDNSIECKDAKTETVTCEYCRTVTNVKCNSINNITTLNPPMTWGNNGCTPSYPCYCYDSKTGLYYNLLSYMPGDSSSDYIFSSVERKRVCD